jgi:hypothetical protein
VLLTCHGYLPPYLLFSLCKPSQIKVQKEGHMYAKVAAQNQLDTMRVLITAKLSTCTVPLPVYKVTPKRLTCSTQSTMDNARMCVCM